MPLDRRPGRASPARHPSEVPRASVTVRLWSLLSRRVPGAVLLARGRRRSMLLPARVPALVLLGRGGRRPGRCDGGRLSGWHGLPHGARYCRLSIDQPGGCDRADGDAGDERRSKLQPGPADKGGIGLSDGRHLRIACFAAVCVGGSYPHGGAGRHSVPNCQRGTSRGIRARSVYADAVEPIARTTPSARLTLLVLACALVLGVGLPASPRAASASESAIPAWGGGVDLYRGDAFATQRTWQWCTAAGVQIVRNIAEGESDEARAEQARYYRYMRANNRYDVPAKDGVDPGGWAAGLRRFVDDRYEVIASDSFAGALRSAVTNLRRTNLPVGLTVAHGTHAWILTGFTATADPLVTDDFRVTSVRVTGPLWGLQSRTRGYDMRPNTRLTPQQLNDYFTPWHYAPIRMAWDGQWVSIQPAGIASLPSAPPRRAREVPSFVTPQFLRSMRPS